MMQVKLLKEKFTFFKKYYSLKSFLFSVLPPFCLFYSTYFAQVFICVCVHISIHPHIHTHTHTYIYIYIYIYNSLFICLSFTVCLSHTLSLSLSIYIYICICFIQDLSKMMHSILVVSI